MKKIIIVVCCSFLLVCSTNAQTLEECRKLAKENYPEIKHYNLLAMSEQFSLSNASKAWLPQVVVSGQMSYQSATPTYPEAFSEMMAANGIQMTGLQKDQYKLSIEVSQNLWDGGQTRANKAIIKADADYQKSQIDVALYNLNSRVDNLYFGILLLDARASLTENTLQVLEGNLSRMKSHLKNGVALQADVDAIEAELLTTRQHLEQIQASRNSYRRMLEVFIGRELTDEPLKRPEMTNIQHHESARPELHMFAAQSALLEKKRLAIQSSLMPKFSAFAQGFHGYPGMDMFKDMMSKRWSFNALIGVRMSWNVTPLYTRKNDLAKLDVAQQQIDVQRDIFNFNTRMQTVQDDEAISRLQRALADDSRIVELRQSVRIAAESKLQNGVIETTELLRKIADETAARLNLTTHEIELLQAIYRLKQTLNQ